MKHDQRAPARPILQEIYRLPSLIVKFPGWERRSHRGANRHLHLNVRHARASRILLHRWVQRLLDRGVERTLHTIVFDDWQAVNAADEADRAQVLEALQITVTASPEQAKMVGVLPAALPEFVSVERSSRCSSSGE